MSEFSYIVKTSDQGIRIDKLLVNIIDDYSRSQIKTWFDKNLGKR